MEKQKKILIVDDDPDLVMIIRHLLEKNGFSVESACDGEECLKKVRESSPDLIVLDVMMPNKDGYQTCKELKSDHRLSEIPVILLTAVADHISTTTFTPLDGMQTEAEDYFEKPVNPEKLLQRIRELL